MVPRSNSSAFINNHIQTSDARFLSSNDDAMTHQSEWIGLDERGLRECRVGRLRNADPLPGQRLEYRPVTEVVVVRVRVDVGQRHAVHLRARQRGDYGRLQVFLLEQTRLHCNNVRESDGVVKSVLFLKKKKKVNLRRHC